MAYFPDPDDVNLPIDTDYVGEATPAELRSIKGKIRDVNLALLDEIGTTSTATAQEAASALATFASDVDDALLALNTSLTNFKALTNNPHGVTKSQVGLANVENWTATSSLIDDSADKYSTAKAANTLHLAIELINTWIAAKEITDADVESRLSTLETNWTAVATSASAAATSSSTSATKATEAAASALAAKNSATAAQNSASSAATSAANSAASAQTATNKATNSLAAALAAQTSATNSYNSASSAQTSSATASLAATKASAMAGKTYTVYNANISGRFITVSINTVASQLGLTRAELDKRMIKVVIGGFWSKRGIYTSVGVLVDMSTSAIKMGTYPYWSAVADSENGATGSAYVVRSSIDHLQIAVPSWYVHNGSWPTRITIGL